MVRLPCTGCEHQMTPAADIDWPSSSWFRLTSAQPVGFCGSARIWGRADTSEQTPCQGIKHLRAPFTKWLLFAAVTRISRWDGFRSDEQSSRAPRTRGNRSLAQFSPTVSNYSWGGPIHQAWHLLDSIIPTLPVWLRAPHVRLRHKLREKKLKNYNKNRSDCLL